MQVDSEPRSPSAEMESGRSLSIRFAKNSVFYFTSQVAGKGLFFLTTIYLARVLGASEYGKFAFAYGFVTLFSVLAKFGLDLLTSRDIGENPHLAGKYLHATLTLRTLLSAGFLLLILIITQFVQKDFEIKQLIFLLAISAGLQSYGGAGTALFEGLQLFAYRSFLNLVVYGLIFLALLISMGIDPGLGSAGVAFLIGTSLYCVISLFLCHKKVAPLGWSRDFPFVWNLFKMAVPLGLMEVFIGIYYRLDTVMLSFFWTDAIVGWYDAAYTFVYGLRLIPVSVALVLLPGLSNLYSREQDKAVRIYRGTMYYSIATGIWITFLIAINAHQLVDLVFGSGYNPSAGVLSLLIWTCVLMFGNALQCIFLLVTQQRVALLRATALGAIANLILNLILIPRWDMYGAAIATFLSELCVFFASGVPLRKFIPLRHFLRIIFPPLSAAVAMYLVWQYSGSIHFIAVSALCTLVYLAVLLSMKKLSYEYQHLR